MFFKKASCYNCITFCLNAAPKLLKIIYTVVKVVFGLLLTSMTNPNF